MKLTVSTLFLALASLATAMPAPVAEAGAGSAPRGLEARANPSWYAVRDVSRIARDRLNGGVADAINNLNNEVAAFGGSVPGLNQAMQDVYARFSQLYDRLGDIYDGAVSVVGP